MPIDVTVAVDLRYALTPDGSAWTQYGMDRRFWERYREVFDSVKIVARAARVDSPPGGWKQVTGPQISLHAVPDFNGPSECLRRLPAVRKSILRAVPDRGAVILRVGSIIANIMEGELRRRGYPYALEVVGDPYDVFSPGAINHPLRPFFRWYFSRSLREQCLRAIGVAYVTKRTLQRRYPARGFNVGVSDVELPEGSIRNAVFETDYSSIELESDAILKNHRFFYRDARRRIITVGSLAQLYKGTDVLISAIEECVRQGLDIEADILGDGRYRPMLIAQAEKAGLTGRVRFHGHVPAGEAVRSLLDSADLFVLPSRTEGLPRAMLEAMARGLPCIGSDVGGIPELLDPTELVPPGNPVALAARIREMLEDPLRLEAQSQRNLHVAKDYRSDDLALRRRHFYKYVSDYMFARESAPACASST
jgi:glycosyltransferase involved in cell wall biosynthesis